MIHVQKRKISDCVVRRKIAIGHSTAPSTGSSTPFLSSSNTLQSPT